MTGFLQAVLRSTASNSVPDVSGAAKKQGKKCKQNERKRCNADADACKTQVLIGCNGNAECIVEANACCETCSADGFLTCLLAANAQNSAVASLR